MIEACVVINLQVFDIKTENRGNTEIRNITTNFRHFRKKMYLKLRVKINWSTNFRIYIKFINYRFCQKIS